MLIYCKQCGLSLSRRMFERPYALATPLDFDILFYPHKYLYPFMLEQLRRVLPNKPFGLINATRQKLSSAVLKAEKTPRVPAVGV